MGFNQFLQDVSQELQEILWKDVPRAPTGKEFDRLEGELYRASTALNELRTKLAELRGRVAEQERRARSLEVRVRVYLQVADRTNAWRHALELDRLRPMLEQDRARLQRCRQACQAQLIRVRQLQEQLDTFPFPKYFRG